MNIRTSKFMCLTRSVLRRLGLTRILYLIIYGTAYEDKFHKRMSSVITGDTVGISGQMLGYIRNCSQVPLGNVAQ